MAIEDAATGPTPTRSRPPSATPPTWPSRTRNPNDLVRVADLMVLRNFYGTVGDPKYQTTSAS